MPLHNPFTGPEDAIAAREREFLAALADAPPEAPLQIRVTERQGVPVVCLDGELDLCTAESFRIQLLELLEREPSALVVDLTSTHYIDSSGLHVLLRAARTLSGRLAVVTPRDRVARIFHATGLSQAISVHRTLPEALQAVSAV